MSKAFDNVRQSTLFWNLIKKGISPIHLRLLLSIYMKQCANVRWNDSLSKTFPIKNGVKQGEFYHHIYTVYIRMIYLDF